MRSNLLASRDQVRMVVTLEPMHDEEFTKMSTLGFSSQLTKLDKEFQPDGRGNRTDITASRRYTGADVQGGPIPATWYVSLLRNSGTRSIERYGAGGPGKEGSVVQAKIPR